MGEFPPLSTPGATRPRRKVTVDAETLDAVPECAKAFLAFMQARGSLSGEPLEVLEQALDLLGEEFKTHAQDRSRWGLATSMFMRMPTEGVDPSQPSAIDACMDDFNSRPREERDAIIGPAADRVARAAGIRIPNGSRASKPRAQRRKGAEGGTQAQPAKADPLTPPSWRSEVASTGASTVGRGLRIPPTQRKCNRSLWASAQRNLSSCVAGNAETAVTPVAAEARHGLGVVSKRTGRATTARPTASFSSARKRKSYSAETSAGAGRPPDLCDSYNRRRRHEPADSPQSASPPREERRRFDRGCPTSCLRTTGSSTAATPVDLAAAIAQIRARRTAGGRPAETRKAAYVGRRFCPPSRQPRFRRGGRGRRRGVAGGLRPPVLASVLVGMRDGGDRVLCRPRVRREQQARDDLLDQPGVLVGCPAALVGEAEEDGLVGAGCE